MAANTRFAVAIHTLGLLAQGRKTTLTSEGIAASVGTNPVVVRRLMAQLMEAGLVEVRKGPHGGAQLARPPEQITLGQIYRAVAEQPILPVHAPQPVAQCCVAKAVGPVLRYIFGDAETAMVKKLDRRRLSEVISEVVKQGQTGSEGESA